MSVFAGALTALVTPFTSDGDIDEARFRALVKRQLDAGIDGLVPCGTTGETPTYSDEEHGAVIRWTVEECAGRVPVLAGVGSNDTATTVRNALRARDAGAQGLLVTTPYYNKPTQEGLYRHFVAVAEACPDLEVCIYDVPGRTVVRVAAETYERLGRIANITCVKDATADMAHAAEIKRVTPDSFTMLSGDDFTTMPHIALGGSGCISVASNIIPERMVALVKAARSGDLATAARENALLQPFFRALFLQTNPLPVKTAMVDKGLLEDHYRLPLCPMDPGPRAAFLELFNAVDWAKPGTGLS